jgi:hypothetical protein
LDFKNEKADEIITEIESEEPEQRIQALEDEIKEVKGSIKKLLLDLREQMSNIENPFRDLKGLTTLIQAPAISKEEEEEEEEEPEEEKKAEEERKKREEEMKKESAAIPLPEILPEKWGEKEARDITEEEFMDPFLVSNLVDWTKDMLSKYGRRRFEEILDLSQLLGYAPEKIVKIIHKISHLCPDTMVGIKEINTNDLVADLHKLHTIVKGDAAKGRILDILLRRD